MKTTLRVVSYLVALFAFVALARLLLLDLRDGFLPPGVPVGAVDFLVVAIFVVDLGLMIRTQLAAGPPPGKVR
jgi:hypothetical protein